MAVDSLLVNFEALEGPLRPKVAFKGGRWRDRLQAKNSVKRRDQKPSRTYPAEGEIEPSLEHHQPPRPDQTTPSIKRRKVDQGHDRNSQAPISKSEVISSLFTYNPVAKHAPQASRVEEALNFVPSNAPLPEGASNFTALGVNTILASHLSMSLKLKAPTAIQKATLGRLLRKDTDAFIQAETGSGKTLAYLIPIVQRLMALKAQGKEAKISRKSGLFALILAPTRELAKQIDETLTSLLKRVPWLVHGTVFGGSTRNHEKARIRKGINILVATPGRLIDHLENTKSFDVGSIRWVALDEGDRLVELGFEDDIKKLFAALDRGKASKSSIESREQFGPDGKDDILQRQPSPIDLPESRTTVLCSATMKMEVQGLDDMNLKNAILIKPDFQPTEASNHDQDGKVLTEKDLVASSSTDRTEENKDQSFLAPAQLKQSYVVSPPKQRLVTLHALLKRTFARKGPVTKAIVFVSCADSVDFHFDVFSRQVVGDLAEVPQPEKIHGNEGRNARKGVTDMVPPRAKSGSKDVEQLKPPPSNSKRMRLSTVAPSPCLATQANPHISLFKLHGSLQQKLRSATLSSFSRSTVPSILLCTDVASRGLDLPNIDLVIEYDPPFSADDHLHRVGRTARAGREGQAICFLMPGPEEKYIDILRAAAGERVVKGESAEDVLRKGFEVSRKDQGEKQKRWDERATDWQLEVERWVVDGAKVGEMAKKAYVSHVRAYATHTLKERGMFDVKHLHLGHLAKAFALREKPGGMGRGSEGKGGKGGERKKIISNRKRRLDEGTEGDAHAPKAREDGRENVKSDRRHNGSPLASDGKDAARKMRAKMHEHMAIAGEFNIG